jgi:ribosomal protein S14
MQHLHLKDKKLRHTFQNFEVKLKLKKFISINLLTFISKKNTTPLKQKLVLYQILKKKKKSILSKIVRRCILTNRSTSIRFFKISRIQSKEMISFGVLPGYKKAVW